MPEQTFSGLFDETAHLDWAPTGALRERARQRRRRQRFAAGAAAAAVVAVVAAGTAFALDRGPGPEPVPPATPTPSVSPSVPVSPPASAGLGSASGSTSSSAPALVTRVPLAAMLTPTDAGSSGWARKDGEDGGDWQTGFTFSICPTADRTPPGEAVDRRWQTLSGPAEKYVLQRVDAFGSAAAARAYLGWVRSNVASCSGFTHENQRIEMSIVDEPPSGDEAYIVRTVGYDQRIQVHGFVRVGNLVTEFLHSDDTTDRAVTMSIKAASRLCAVTQTC